MKGLVLGKFLPFHKGHQALITYALAHVEQLYVMVCCSDHEDIPAAVRVAWIRDTFAHETRLHVVPFSYRESDLPNTSVADYGISAAWAAVIARLFPDISAIITSEKYGDYVAEILHIRHILFDSDRLEIPISATLIRANPHLHWDFLPDAVKRSFQRKLVLLGTESTGKSTLASALHAVYRSSLVTEAGRDIVPDSTEVTTAQLAQIVTAHHQSVREACAALQPLVILDTDVHITQSYSMFLFGQHLDVPDEIYLHQKADVYCYLAADFPYVQDGTRLPLAQRNLLDVHHRATLAHFGVSYTTVTGDWDSRLAQIQRQVEGIWRWSNSPLKAPSAHP